MNHPEERYLIVPCPIIPLTRAQAAVFRHVEAEWGHPDRFDDAGDDPDPCSEIFLVDLHQTRTNNPAGAQWLEQRGYPLVAGCRVTPYAGYDRVRFVELFPDGTWNGYWDEKAYALFMLPPEMVQKYLGEHAHISAQSGEGAGKG